MAAQIWNLLKQGGPLMIPIGVCSVVAIAIIIQKIVELHRGRVIPEEVVHWVERGDVSGGGLPSGRKFRSPAAVLVGQVIANRSRSFAVNHQLLQSAGQQVTLSLQRGLRGLEIITTISPLLGLAGTIQGLIVLFGSIDSVAATDSSDLARGIGIALFTTFAGLLVSIPSVIGWHVFHRRAEILSSDLESLCDTALKRIYEGDGEGRGEKGHVRGS